MSKVVVEGRDFGAMLVLQALLTDTFERVSTTTLSLGERSIGAIYLYDGLPAGLAVYVNGNRVDPALAIKELLVVSKTLADRPLNDATLRRFKSAAQGTFVTDATAYADRAYYLGTFGAYGLGADPLNAALASLDNATASDVQRVAKRYLQRFVVALVVPRQTSTGN
ncbi:MAG: hypothetical protein GIW95_08695 [Candidatus Eremiobacteraeota bacterium]|nr:hypothetical protein [Candidatus Eremiobacteraeota bacterium]